MSFSIFNPTRQSQPKLPQQPVIIGKSQITTIKHQEDISQQVKQPSDILKEQKEQQWKAKMDKLIGR